MTAYVATVARSLEPALLAELAHHGIRASGTDRGAVRFEGPLTDAYRVCLWSRVASRVLLPLATVDARSADALYDGIHALPWGEHLVEGGTLAVTAVGTNRALRNSHFTVLRSKDAIVDRLRAARGERPSIAPDQPDLRVHVHVDGDTAQVAVDLSGDPLHLRGHGRDGGPAPLKETLAAGILWFADWPRLAAEGAALVDPMCGSGTFVIEGAGMALRRAPGLRRRFGFELWTGHDETAWRALLDEAREVALDASPAPILGSDREGAQAARARANLVRADLAHAAKILRRPWDRLGPPDGVREQVPHGIVVVNPPYGERMGELAQAEAAYRELGDRLRRQWLGWTAYVLAGSKHLAKHIGLRPTARIPVRNGPLDCRLLELPIATQKVARDR